MTFLVSAFRRKRMHTHFRTHIPYHLQWRTGNFFPELVRSRSEKGSGNSEAASINSSGDKITVSGLEYGDVISCDAQDGVSLNDNSKYYVKEYV